MTLDFTELSTAEVANLTKDDISVYVTDEWSHADIEAEIKRCKEILARMQ